MSLGLFCFSYIVQYGMSLGLFCFSYIVQYGMSSKLEIIRRGITDYRLGPVNSNTVNSKLSLYSKFFLDLLA